MIRLHLDRSARSAWRFTTALVVLATTPGSFSAEIDEKRLSACRGKTDALERLVCFDALASSVTSTISGGSNTRTAKQSYKPVSLVDFRTDAAELQGQRIELAGVLQQLGDMILLKEEIFSMNAVFVDINAIPREDRRRVFQYCGQS